jgi:hypothetical protein
MDIIKDASENEEVPKHALNLAWTYGMNNGKFGKVHNLRDKYRTGVFYASGTPNIL